MKCLYQHIPLGGGGGPGLEQVHRCLGSTRRSKSSDWKANLCYSIWLSRTKGADGKMKWGFENPGALLFAKNFLTIGLLQAVCICIMTRHTKKASGTKLSLQLRVGQFEVRQTSSDLHDICWLFSPHHTLQHNMQLTGERALQRHHSPTCVDWGPVHHCLRL